jgi:type I restriction enzyme S subunit
MPIIRIQNVDSVRESDFVYWDGPFDDRFVVRNGDLLLTLSGSFRVVVWEGPDALLNQRIVKLIPKSGFTRDWLLYVLRNGLEAISGMGRHALVSNVALADLRLLKIPFQTVEEQRRIAAILDQAETLRTQRRTALALLDSLTQSLFLDMFGDPAKNTLGLPTKQLGELGDWHSGGTPPRSKSHYFEGDIPWFSSGELESMYVSDSVEHISDAAMKETATKLVPAGSLMMGMYDTAALKTSIALRDCSCNQAIAFSKLDPTLADTAYVYYAIVVGREHFRRLQRGVRQKNLNLSMVREIRIPHPPLPLQQTFATRIASIEALKATHRRALAALDALFASLQQRAFAGQL